MRYSRMVAVVALALLLVAPGVADAATLSTGRAEYRLSWNGIPAAYATVEVSHDQSAGEPVYRVETTARTSWLVDLLWRLRARAASTFTSDQLAPLGFRYDREENSRHSVTDVAFTPSPPLATGTYRRGGQSKVMTIEASDLLDPITAVFHALVQPVQLGDTLHYDVFTGEARYLIELHIRSEEVVTVPQGTYKAWRVEPRLWRVGSGLEPRLRRATLWVSQDPTHVLLRIRSEVFIGAVNCDLLHLQAAPAPPVL